MSCMCKPSVDLQTDITHPAPASFHHDNTSIHRLAYMITLHSRLNISSLLALCCFPISNDFNSTQQHYWLIKTVTLGMVEGDRPRGRRAKKRSDDIVEWCGCSLLEVVRLTSDRQRCRELTGLNGSHGPWVAKEKKKEKKKTATLMSTTGTARQLHPSAASWRLCCPHMWSITKINSVLATIYKQLWLSHSGTDSIFGVTDTKK